MQSCNEEHCKKLNLTDPMFELSNENILEHFRNKDNLFKKTEFTMKCEVFGKVFYGKGFSKKEAKKKAAEDAWNDLTESSKTKTEDKCKLDASQALTISKMIAQVKAQHQIINK